MVMNFLSIKKWVRKFRIESQLLEIVSDGATGILEIRTPSKANPRIASTTSILVPLDTGCKLIEVKFKLFVFVIGILLE